MKLSPASDSSPSETIATRAVLLMAYGSPRSAEEILPYYTHMRGGRPPRPEALAGLEARYRAIGGRSPLTEITLSQASALQDLLRSQDGPGWSVTVGMKHIAPFIEDAVAGLVDAGIREAVGVVLAPHYSRMSVAGYVERARAASAGSPLEISFVEDWHLEPSYLSWLARAISTRLAEIGPTRAEGAMVIFTAHSLPARLREMGDPYPDQLGETAAAVAKILDLPRWDIGWQSVAQDTGEPWLGPELLEVVRRAASGGITEFLVCPCGFVADHLEVRYDLDVEAQRAAAELGITISRTAMPNDDAAFIAVLRDVVRRGMASPG
ncbi:MAG: ferrochelatase [Candidatus Dormibacteraeota bacterium]|nr:ferrochelatase [Candidatus Dormibacteraeota bacterium]